VLRLTLSDGYGTSVYLNPRSWFISRRRDVRPLHVDIDPRPTTIENLVSDFRKVSDVYFGFASSDKDLETGKVVEETRIRSIKVNPDFAEAIFDKL